MKYRWRIYPTYQLLPFLGDNTWTEHNALCPMLLCCVFGRFVLKIQPKNPWIRADEKQ